MADPVPLLQEILAGGPSLESSIVIPVLTFLRLLLKEAVREASTEDPVPLLSRLRESKSLAVAADDDAIPAFDPSLESFQRLDLLPLLLNPDPNRFPSDPSFDVRRNSKSDASKSSPNSMLCGLSPPVALFRDDRDPDGEVARREPLVGSVLAPPVLLLPWLLDPRTA